MIRPAVTIIGIFCLALAGCGDKPDGANAAAVTGSSPSAIAIASAPAQLRAPADDLFAFAAGAQIVGMPSGDQLMDLNYGPLNLIDESTVTDWTSAAGAPAVIVLELAERTALARLSFDTAGMLRDAKSPKSITVELSDTSANAGYKAVLTTDLKSGVNDQSFTLAAPGIGRWVRVTILNNHGDDYYGMTGIHGFGEQLTHDATIANVSGTYEGASGWGMVHLKQEGSRVLGCYDYREGLIAGGVEGRMLKVEMDEKVDDGTVARQIGLFSFASDGKSLFGLTRDVGDAIGTALSSHYSGEKVSNDIGDCKAIADWRGQAAKSQLSAELRRVGRARLDGVNFDFNSAVIQAGSRPLLDQVAQMLKEHDDWRAVLERRTDNVGGAAFNKNLSSKRAAAVQAYLIAAGISAARLSSTGFGDEKPVASNDTQAGRAQNRRVEIVRQ